MAEPSSNGIAGRIVRAAGAQGINQLARVGQLFLLVPICLGSWGTATYEDWLLVNSVTAFLVLADLGYTQFTTVKLIDAWSRGDRERFAREWGIALAIFAALSAVLAVVFALAWIAPAWASLIPVRQLPQRQLASITVLLSIGLLSGEWIGLGLGAYRARGDLSRSYHVSSIYVAAQTAGIAIPAALGEGPVGSASGSCLVSVVMLLCVVADFAFRYPDMAWKPIWPPREELLRRVRDSVGYLISPIATTIFVNAPNLILASTGAPEGAIALFGTTRTIAGVARQLPYQFAHPAGVELAGLLARGVRGDLSRLYENASRALAIVVGVLSGFTVVAAPLVMVLWTRGKVTYDPYLMLLLVGTTAICAPAQVAITLLWYGGFPGLLNRALIFSTILSMGLSILLAPFFQVHGVAIGLGVGEIAAIAVYLALLVDRLLERKPGIDLARNFGVSLLTFAASAAGSYLLYRVIDPHGWFGLVEFGCAWSIPGAAGLFWLLPSSAQQARAIATMVSFVRSKRARWRLKNANPADYG
jgi:O-antigen/teichoic acid export membrane protein